MGCSALCACFLQYSVNQINNTFFLFSTVEDVQHKWQLYFLSFNKCVVFLAFLTFPFLPTKMLNMKQIKDQRPMEYLNLIEAVFHCHGWLVPLDGRLEFGKGPEHVTVGCRLHKSQTDRKQSV